MKKFREREKKKERERERERARKTKRKKKLYRRTDNVSCRGRFAWKKRG